MSNDRVRSKLARFADDHTFTGKGALSIALIVTEHARTQGLPLNPDTLITDSGGQVRGTGRSAVQAILKRHGISRVLAAEGGRTSRGSIGNMRDYVAFLNNLNVDDDLIDLTAVEFFWIERVQRFFAGKPFKVSLDSSRSIRALVRNVLTQAYSRQQNTPGMQYVGAVLQHLVGAKLACALGEQMIKHHSFSTADAPGGRAGDFVIGDAAIHVTTSPGEAVIERCCENLADNYRPILITLQKGLIAADVLAENRNIADRIDLFEIEQFIALNLYELGRFNAEGRKLAVTELVEHYNRIIDSVETDPSLKIELRP